MTRKRFHGLKKVKVRATWNKYNLYNLWRLRAQFTARQTYYQQKWEAKSMTRAYHGEHIAEKKWQRMFSPRASAVVSFNPEYLATNDGSEFAAGRGSGKEVISKPGDKKIGPRKNYIPFMNMTYAPIERRLDMAVWRAMFASSARQARQFVIHGMVKVNGKKMPHAGYLLNPGDMFQVDVDRVLYATGASKTVSQAKSGRKLRKVQSRAKKLGAAPKKKKSVAPTAVSSTSAARAQPIAKTKVDIDEVRRQRRLDLRELLVQIDDVLKDKRRRVGAKRKITIRAFVRDVRLAMATVSRKTEKELDDQLSSLISQLAIAKAGHDESSTTKEPVSKPAGPSPEEQMALREAIKEARENPVDASKAYATPWRPRPYMSAFAFIPKYLEVNHNICSAVYLRHPQVRKGMAEVPSPFPEHTQQLAFNWYLRRGR